MLVYVPAYPILSKTFIIEDLSKVFSAFVLLYLKDENKIELSMVTMNNISSIDDYGFKCPLLKCFYLLERSVY